MSNRFYDLVGVIKGGQKVIASGLKLQEEQLKHIWANSNLKPSAFVKNFENIDGSTKRLATIPQPADLQSLLFESLQRSSMIVEGLRALSSVMQSVTITYIQVDKFDTKTMPPKGNLNFQQSSTLNIQPLQVENINETSRSDKRIIEEELILKSKVSHKPIQKPENILPKVQKIEQVTSSQPKVEPLIDALLGNKLTPSLSDTAKQRKVPSSRIGRMISFGGLAAGLGFGTAAEATRRALGVGQPQADNILLTPANVNRIVDTLCKVRGAALKIGQILSIQDNTVISPTLQAAFERVRQSADFMPYYQVEGVMKSEFGPDWRKQFDNFEMRPFAAASIGQVHKGTLPDGTAVAIKIQYPGVAAGINSDIENLVSILNLWDVFPKGMFLDNLVNVAKKELSWEVDYEREAECTHKFKELLEPYPMYQVPDVIDDLSTSQVFTTELVEGIPVDKCIDFDLETRSHICSLLMNLCLKELFIFRYMQTDPNWSNFFYNPKTKKLVLLDFGATRSYSKEFMDKYITIIKAAADGKRDDVLKISLDMGFLTGYETQAMKDAHVETVMILGEVFNTEEEFDFRNQNTTQRVTKLVPTILTSRLCPPPEEIYSLHRKLSGVFLLCSKLSVKISCRPLLMEIYKNYKFGEIGSG